MIYKLQFKPLSPITSLPDSQAIFGAFCDSYHIYHGKNGLEEFLEQLVKNKNLLFSSMFFDNTLPRPNNLVASVNTTLTIDEVKVMKKTKKIKYIEKDVYLEYLDNKELFCSNLSKRIGKDLIINDNYVLCNYNSPQKYLTRAEDVRVRNNKEDHNLFYNYVNYYSKESLFCVYLKADNIDDINNVLLNNKFLSIGPKKSIGYNLFEYLGYEEEVRLNNLNSGLLISKMLCDKRIDFHNSNYFIAMDCSKFNNNADTVFRKSKVCLLEGSIINSNELLGDICIEKAINHNNYQYLLGFTI